MLTFLLLICYNFSVRVVHERLEKANFLRRPNRFVAECMLSGRPVSAYLPNPGRLWELLVPGCTLYVKRNPPSVKTSHTVIAVEKEGTPVLLHTHMANDVAEILFRRKLIPGWEDAEIVRREAMFGKSRFDFLATRNGREMVIEVKSCTLFRERLAMFPDAVTARGSRHLLELEKLSREGMQAGVLFVVQWPRAEYFMPEHHTDLAFSQNLLKVHDAVDVKAVSVRWGEGLSLSDTVRELVIPWEKIGREAKDCGSYIVILRLDRDRHIETGELGTVFFRKGYYLYAGSAKKGLTKRIERHQRLRKNLFWHIDYLREKASSCRALPVRTPEDLECSIAGSLKEIAGRSVKGFGSSDCRCESHLFWMENDPIRSPAFIDMLNDWRVGRIEKELIDDDTSR